MQVSLRVVVRAFLVAAVLGVLTATIGTQIASTAVSGDGQCPNDRTPCPNVACVSACWADGTVHNHGTKVKETQFAPVECGVGAHGCITQSCP